MTRNITLGLPDDVGNQMDAYPEVSWSNVAKTGIIQYLELRKNPDMSPLLDKLQKQKGEEYVEGRKKAEEIAEKSGYRMLDILMKKYWKACSSIDAMEMTGYTPDPWESIPTPEAEFQRLLIELKVIETDVSTEFAKGMRDRLVEIEKALPK